MSLSPVAIALIVGAVVFLAVVALMAKDLVDYKRASGWMRALRPLGFERAGLDSVRRLVGLFEHMQRGWPVEVFLRRDGQAVTLVTMIRESKREELDAYLEAVALRLPGADMPRFRLRPEGFFDSIKSAVGMDDIDFLTDPEFSALYHLTGERGSAIRDLFGHSLRSAFTRRLGWHAQGHGEWLVLTKRRHQGSRRLAAFVQEAQALAEAFQPASPVKAAFE